MCDGDARTALNVLDIALRNTLAGIHQNVEENTSSNRPKIELQLVCEAFQKAHLLYDKTGMQFICICLYTYGVYKCSIYGW